MFSASRTASLLSLLLATARAISIGPVTDLHIVNTEVSPDGYPRHGVLAEGTFPGPLIKGMKGDSFKINVIDNLTNSTMKKSTSIHWHGITQHGTTWADGAAAVSQCPITTGHSFQYKFQEPDQAGTFWYHSHLSTQYCDGLRGPFVIYDPHDPFRALYDVDDENTVITLADWYHTAAPLLPIPAFADATLINGLGRYAADPTAPLAVINVQKGKRYRFRVINISCDPNYVFSIDGHDMTIIEVDGVNHLPYKVDSIQIFAGQRYSFVLNANKPIGNYWVRALPESQPKLAGFAQGINSAILRYVGAPDGEPTTAQASSVKPLKETDLRPLVNPIPPGKPWPGGADVVVTLNPTFNFTDRRFYINNHTFHPPTTPVLLQILSGAKTAQELLPKGSVYTLPRDKVIEIVLLRGTAVGGPHPMHLHGHTFSVVKSAGSSGYNFLNPVQRDTVSIGTNSSDWVTIRFKTDNPGPWFLHCHIDFHLEGGFAVVMAEDVLDTKFVNPVPEAWDALCPQYDSLQPGDQ